MPATHFLAIAALALGSVAVAAPAVPPPQQAPIDVTGKKVSRDDQIICKDASTGTMITRHLCMTRAEWDKKSADSDDQLQDMRDFQRIRCGGIAC